MTFKTFFSEQAKKPSGIFGRLIMPIIFDRGNVAINKFMGDLLTLKENDHVLEIGFGTGKFINEMAKFLNEGLFEGIDLSNTMVVMAERKNRKYIANGKVIIAQGDFGETVYRNDSFDKICSANTIYFWPNPDNYAKKIFRILKPGGKLILAFEDSNQLKSKPLSTIVFKFYSLDEIENLFNRNGFSGGVEIFSRKIKSQRYHCAVAVK